MIGGSLDFALRDALDVQGMKGPSATRAVFRPRSFLMTPWGLGRNFIPDAPNTPLQRRKARAAGQDREKELREVSVFCGKL